MSHHVTLVNRGVSTVSINLSIEERHFRVTGLEHANNSKKEFTTLQPCDSVHVSVFYSIKILPLLNIVTRPLPTLFMVSVIALVKILAVL